MNCYEAFYFVIFEMRYLLSILFLSFIYTQDCCDAEDVAISDCGGMMGCYIPQCTESCAWEPMQCWGSTGYCWCVDEDGVEIPGTSMPSWQGLPDCAEFEYQLGDINYDGNVDVLDAIETIDLVLYGEYNPIVDMDNNGVINILDIIDIIYIILD